MPSHRQLLTEPHAKGGTATTGLGLHDLGSADYAAMRAMFPSSPAYNGSYGDAQVVSEYQRIVQAPVINDGGHTFGTVNIDYQDAPNLEDVVVGGEGLPGTPYSPNPARPESDSPNGPGVNMKDAPAIDPSLIHKGAGGYGNGDGLASPSTTAINVARQTIGNLIFGKSTPR